MSNLYVKDILLTETYKNYNFTIKDAEEKTIDAKTFLNVYKQLQEKLKTHITDKKAMTQDVVKDALNEILNKIDPNIKTPITIKTTVEESNTNSYLEFIKDLMFRYILLGLKDPVYSQVFNIVDDQTTLTMEQKLQDTNFITFIKETMSSGALTPAQSKHIQSILDKIKTKQ